MTGIMKNRSHIIRSKYLLRKENSEFKPSHHWKHKNGTVTHSGIKEDCEIVCQGREAIHV
jgi:hypothetical protein